MKPGNTVVCAECHAAYKQGMIIERVFEIGQGFDTIINAVNDMDTAGAGYYVPWIRRFECRLCGVATGDAFVYPAGLHTKCG